MPKLFRFFLLPVMLLLQLIVYCQTGPDTIVLKDLVWDKTSPASSIEVFIPSGGGLLQGIFYKANGGQKHPTLLLLHGYPGNEKNLDLAQVVRSHGWNVLYFNYRGSWASQGDFSFTHCVEDVVNAVAYCKQYRDSLHIDTGNIVLFGHSMGGWIALKAVQQLPGIKKVFALSVWDIYGAVKSNALLVERQKEADDYFVLHKKSGKDLFQPVLDNPAYYYLGNDSLALSNKQIIMLYEHTHNEAMASSIKSSNKNYFRYMVWPTDHSFTNKRVSLMRELLAFLDR